MNKKILSAVIGSLIVGIGMGFYGGINLSKYHKSKIKNKIGIESIATVQETKTRPCLNHDIVEMVTLFPKMEFRELKNNVGDILAMEGKQGNISMLGIGSKGIEGVSISIPNGKEQETKEFLKEVTNVFLKGIGNDDNLLLKLIKEGDTSANIADCTVSIMKNDGYSTMEIVKIK